MIDVIGNAIYDFYTDNNPEDIITESSISDNDIIPIKYLFRNFDEMPIIEQKALQLSKGKVLDIGCAAGSHSLYLQDRMKLDVTSIDISEKSIEVCKKRGLKNTTCINYKDFYTDEKFDTILILMNGIGLCEELVNITNFLSKIKSLLKTDGQVLVDSSDIIYMFDEDEDGGIWVNLDKYYGEVEFKMKYKNLVSETFKWLYLDFNTLQNACFANKLNCELVQEGEHFDFLAKITHLSS